jgi:hypothetical protein
MLRSSTWPGATPRPSTVYDSPGTTTPICVPEREADIHDIGSLVGLHNDLFAA